MRHEDVERRKIPRAAGGAIGRALRVAVRRLQASGLRQPALELGAPGGTLQPLGKNVLVREARGEREEKKTLFEAIRERLEPGAAEVPGLPRLTGGAVGYLGYDAVRLFPRVECAGEASAVVGWRVAIGLLAILPLAAAIVMRRGLPEPELAPRRGGWTRHLTNVRLLGVPVGSAALFFLFVGSLQFIPQRPREPPGR